MQVVRLLLDASVKQNNKKNKNHFNKEKPCGKSALSILFGRSRSGKRKWPEVGDQQFFTVQIRAATKFPLPSLKKFLTLSLP
jgi:hypothetical protein